MESGVCKADFWDVHKVHFPKAAVVPKPQSSQRRSRPKDAVVPKTQSSQSRSRPKAAVVPKTQSS